MTPVGPDVYNKDRKIALMAFPAPAPCRRAERAGDRWGDIR